MASKKEHSGRDKAGRFIQGNKISVGNCGGRPLKFKTPKLLGKKCDDYFDWVDNNPWIRKEVIKSGDLAGKIIDAPTQRPYTLNALCQYLGILTNCWRDYEQRSEFSRITTYVREIIDNQQFEGAMVGAFNASLTARRLGLTDKTEQTVKVEQPLFKLKDVSNNDSNK